MSAAKPNEAAMRVNRDNAVLRAQCRRQQTQLLEAKRLIAKLNGALLKLKFAVEAAKE